MKLSRKFAVIKAMVVSARADDAMHGPSHRSPKPSLM